MESANQSNGEWITMRVRVRPGLTLTEVLVTLAILAFGILGILTLFPLAASQMAVAVREDRSAQAAAAADAYMRAYWKSEVADKIRDGGTVTEPFFHALDNPNMWLPTTPIPTWLPLSEQHLIPPVFPALGGEPSYPVVIDPIGYTARSGAAAKWVGDGGMLVNVPRRTLNRIGSTPQEVFRACSLMDGMSYDENGHPSADRELRYNWSWVIQRPDNGNKRVADMAVIVYDNRPNLYAPTGSEGWFLTLGVMLPGSSSLKLSFNAGVAPNIKPGSWIMDATVPLLTLPPNKTRHANFYQVVSVAPDISGTALNIELHNPLKKSNDPTILGAYLGTFVVMRGVSNVYQRPPLTAD